uniref:Uncharacterized protein n=1 Tax=Magnetospirillum gryphiswaldense TaxID=55518 RepID=Q3BK93_9PROT|nr:hypothetical protein mgI515 [Magnetospirillum gryphiswaldense MSR-1]CAM78043.1 hypothetical protein MGR_4111 [Magnetospirillum gryphiswaldense MSR-1]
MPSLVGERPKAAGPVRPVLRLDLHLRHRRTRYRGGIRPGPADGIHRHHEPVPGRVRQDPGPRRSHRHGPRWCRMARRRRPGCPWQRHLGAAAAIFARVQPPRAHLALPARTLPLNPSLDRPERHHRRVLRRLECFGRRRPKDIQPRLLSLDREGHFIGRMV